MIVYLFHFMRLHVLWQKHSFLEVPNLFFLAINLWMHFLFFTSLCFIPMPFNWTSDFICLSTRLLVHLYVPFMLTGWVSDWFLVGLNIHPCFMLSCWFAACLSSSSVCVIAPLSHSPYVFRCILLSVWWHGRLCWLWHLPSKFPHGSVLPSEPKLKNRWNLNTC